MERHAEIVRQWRLLLALEGKSRGLTLAEATQTVGEGVSDRTIRRDFDALGQAGFPIETTKRDGKTYFCLNKDVFKGVAAAGFSLSELCALHLSRAVLTAVAGGPFRDSLASAFDKLYDALPPSMWKFIESLPDALGAKEHASRPRGAASAKAVDTLMHAILARRRVRMRYHSFSSQQVKDYIVEPYRLAYAQGGLYLQAHVPEYGERRTFAAQRIEHATALEETFDPVASGDAEVFPHSLGAFSGTPEEVVIEFSAGEAPYVREREFHASQRIDDLPDGRLRLTMDVVIDWELQAWVMGFGPAAKVIAPESFAKRIVESLEEARASYLRTE
ncbi:MAG TPA: WYL domain-containing transcriptional regulator [Vicinamibacterales bacterium]|nr:WYL domain-containing transcriptional regulator [Vicinamibacterales bacterium]